MPNDKRPRILEVVRPGVPAPDPVIGGSLRFDPTSLDRPTIERCAIPVETRANPLDLERAIATLVNTALTAAGLTDDQRRAVDVRTYLADGGHVVTVQIVAPIDREQAARIVESANRRGS